MDVPTTCAACGQAGALAPYRDIAAASGWAHTYAHLDCVRYRAKTRALVCQRGHRVIPSTGECYTLEEITPGEYVYVYGCRP